MFAINGPWPGLLAIAPAPAPGNMLERNLRRWQRLGLTGVFSLLEPSERPGWEHEADICHSLGLNFYSLPIRDHAIPGPHEMEKVSQRLEEVERALQHGQRIAAHCFAGIGRSGMATVGLLMIAGIPMEDAIQRVSLARGLVCPETDEQVEWLASFDRFRRVS
ncbi:MAG TPA: hypothetical protein VGL89_02200 [Candidatus Koribacter sp.]|jgi:predicted protein tyrosine phosphatase